MWDELGAKIVTLNVLKPAFQEKHEPRTSLNAFNDELIIEVIGELCHVYENSGVTRIWKIDLFYTSAFALP